MPKTIDLTGQRFGSWTVLRYAGASKWDCLCACGTEKAVLGKSLKTGSSTSCGCLRSKLLSARRSSDIAGQRFGKPIAIKRTGSDQHLKAMWLCLCDCGGSTNGISGDLRAGKLRSCGCSKRIPYSSTKDEIGKVYGRLTVLRWWGTNYRRRAKWLCQCSCGRQSVVLGDYLRGGDTQSCGCRMREWSSHLGKTVGQYNRCDDCLRVFHSLPEHAQSVCNLYFVEVCNISDKIGISTNVERRGQGNYTAVWKTWQTNRATAWCVEQQALRATVEAAVLEIPAGFTMRDGHSELRQGLPIDETVQLLDDLVTQAQELGWEAFAERHQLLGVI